MQPSRAISAALVFLCAVACTKKEGAEAPPIPVLPGPAKPPASVTLPEGAIAWGVTGSPQKLISALEALGSKAAPVPAGAIGMGISAGLISLGLKDTSVVDLAGPAGLLVLDPTKNPASPAVVALSCKGAKELLASLEPAWKAKPEQAGLIELSREKVDPSAVFAGKKDAPAAPPQTESLFLRFEGKLALASENQAALQAGAPVLLERLRSGVPESGLVVGVSVANLKKIFATQIAQAPAMLKPALKAALGGIPSPTANPKLLGFMGEWFIDRTLALVQQTRQLGFALGADPAGATFHIALEPEPGSFFESLLKAQKPSALDLGRALPEGSPMAFAGNFQWRSYEADLKAFAKEVMALVLDKPAESELLAILDEAFKLLGEEFAMSYRLGPDGSVQIAEVFSVTDTAAMKAMILRSIKAFGTAFADPKALGVGVRYESPKGIGTHQGVELTEVSAVLDLSVLPPQQQALMKQVYGGNRMRMVFAFFDGLCALALGSQADQDIRALIDRVKGQGAALPSSKAFQTAAAGLEKGAGGYLYLSIADFIAAGVKSTFAATGQDISKLKLPEIKSGVFFRFGQENGQLVQSLRVPAEHLAETGAVFKALSGAGAP